MNFLALLFSLPTLAYGGCCIVPVVLRGVETFRASVGTPANTCEGQWADLSCDQFETAQETKSKHGGKKTKRSHAKLVKPEEPIANLSAFEADSVSSPIGADSSADSVTSSDLLTDSAIAFEPEELLANLSTIEADTSADSVTSSDLPTDSAIPLESEESANSTVKSIESGSSAVTSSDLPTDSAIPLESPPSLLVEANLSVAVLEADPAEARPTLSFRFADLSGCGAFRTCPGCIANTGCMWSLSGCTKSTGSMEQWCSPVPNEDTVKLPCELLTGCNKCTSTAGCIWYRGTCAYSRGIGCVSDPDNCINYAWNCPAEYINPVIPRYQGGSILPANSNVFGAPTLVSTPLVPGSLAIVGSQVLVPVSSPNPQLTIVPVTPSATLQSASSQEVRYFSDSIVQPLSQQRPPTPQVYSPQPARNSQAPALIVPAYSQPATSQVTAVQPQRSVPPSSSSQQAQFRPSPPLVRSPNLQSSSNFEPSYSRPNTTPTDLLERQPQYSSRPQTDNQFIISSFFDQANTNSQPQPNFQPTNYVDFSQSTPVQYRPPQSYLSEQFPYSGPNAQHPEPRQFSQYYQPPNFPQTLQSSSYVPQLGQTVANQVLSF